MSPFLIIGTHCRKEMLQDLTFPVVSCGKPLDTGTYVEGFCMLLRRQPFFSSSFKNMCAKGKLTISRGTNSLIQKQ